MKILHTSDWHLGKKLENISRFDEQREVMMEICEIADKEQVDAVIVAGDLFDAYNPPAEAVDLFYQTLKRLSDEGTRPVIAIAGNHDSPDRIEAPDPLARECGIIFTGYPHCHVPVFELKSGLKVVRSDAGFVELQLPGTKVPLRVLMTPYANEFRLKTHLGIENREEELRKVLQQSWTGTAEKYCDNKGVNILVSHLFIVARNAELPAEPDDEKSILHAGGVQAVYTENIPPHIQYTALGHLHRMHHAGNGDAPVVYSGSPLAYSFSEASQDKYVVLIEAGPAAPVAIRNLKLTSGKRLLRYRAEGVDAAINWLQENQGCLVELTLMTDTFLTAQDRKLIHAVHDGIVTIIPEVNDPGKPLPSLKDNIDPGKDIQSLFKEYFLYSRGQEPNNEIMQLFNEVLASDDSESL